MEVGAATVEWLEARRLDVDTAISLGIYTGRRAPTGEVVPDGRGNIVCFPYRDRGQVVAEKYRTPDKRFWQKSGGQRTFFNADVLDDPALWNGPHPLVIVEGEADCIAMVQAGFPYTVSVPDGAPPARDPSGKLIEVPEDTRDIDPDNDDKFRFIASNWDRLKRIKRIVIAVDNDEPGVRLAAELVRRLGRVRCYFVEFPRGCKDANDVILKHGEGELRRVLEACKPYPVAGVYLYQDLPNEPDIDPKSTGWAQLDELMRVYHPAFMVVAGRAGHGKSSWTQQLVANLAADYGWTIAIASFEMRIKPFVSDALAAAYLRKARYAWTPEDHGRARGFLERHFCFIAPEPDNDRLHDIDWLIEKAEVAVIRYGARVVLIDPWNEIEHSRRGNETTTEYTNRAIMALKSFGRRFDVLVIVVAHPTKSGAAKDPGEMSLYDISDSAAFQNKADLGVIVARLGEPGVDTTTGIYVKKVRYQPATGQLGSAELTFDAQSRLFY